MIVNWNRNCITFGYFSIFGNLTFVPMHKKYSFTTVVQEIRFPRHKDTIALVYEWTTRFAAGCPIVFYDIKFVYTCQKTLVQNKNLVGIGNHRRRRRAEILGFTCLANLTC